MSHCCDVAANADENADVVRVGVVEKFGSLVSWCFVAILVGIKLDTLATWRFDTLDKLDAKTIGLDFTTDKLDDDSLVADNDDELDDDCVDLGLAKKPSRFLCDAPPSLGLFLFSGRRLMANPLSSHAVRWFLQFDKNFPPLYTLLDVLFGTLNFTTNPHAAHPAMRPSSLIMNFPTSMPTSII